MTRKRIGPRVHLCSLWFNEDILALKAVQTLGLRSLSFRPEVVAQVSSQSAQLGRELLYFLQPGIIKLFKYKVCGRGPDTVFRVGGVRLAVRCHETNEGTLEK